jgi:hypothetical protein
VAFVLEAVLAPTEVADALAARLPWARLVPLAQGLRLIPVTDGETPLLCQEALPAALASALEEVSTLGPAAYVEAALHGGDGEQGCMVWSGGDLILGPLVAEVPTGRIADGPINQALRQLGVRVTEGAVDEFDSVDLGRRRLTADWLELAEDGPR